MTVSYHDQKVSRQALHLLDELICPGLLRLKHKTAVTFSLDLYRRFRDFSAAAFWFVRLCDNGNNILTFLKETP